MPETLTACPVCTGTEISPFLNLAYYPEGMFHLCKCGAAFLNPRMTELEAIEWYRSGKYRERTGADDIDHKDSLEQQKQRAEYIAQVPKVKIESHLDIGSSNGDLLRAIAKLNPGARSEGVDIDPVLTQDEFTVYQSIDEVPGTFDLITCIQTLEHIANPRKMVTGIYDHLNPGGAVIVEVPNRRAALFAFAAPQHVIAYDEASLRGLFIGYKAIQVSLHGYPYQSPLDLSILLTANK